MEAVKLSGGSPTIYTTKYGEFKGVDFSTDDMLVNKSRSPYAVNLISDADGRPEKRPGWETILQLDGKINGIWKYKASGTERFIIHAGSKLYKWVEGENPELLLENINDEKSTAFFYEAALYILTGKEYLGYSAGDYEAEEDVSSGTHSWELVGEVYGYIPTVVTYRKPNGGGTNLEAYNLISPKWKEEFVGDGESREYQLTATELDEATVDCEIFENGTWNPKTENTDFTVDRAQGKVTFNTAPHKSEIPNVKLTPSKTRGKYAEKITKGKSAVVYENVVFMAGAEKGIDYRSGFGKPNYFPDTGYDRIGTNNTDIMGYCQVGEYLGIIKEDSNQESTLYLRWADVVTRYSTTGTPYQETVYKKKQGIAGVGAISRHCIGPLLDEPLFLSRQGVFAVTSNAITLDRTVQNRSKYVDLKLTKEKNLENAIGGEWNGYFLIAINGNCYILDSRQRSYPKYSNSAFLYECYYWENVPAIAIYTEGSQLYFGTKDGKICRFKENKELMSCYSDDGAPIIAIWSTCADDDGHPTRMKTMVKKGCSVTLKPYSRSSVMICVRTEKDAEERVIRTDTVDNNMFFDFDIVDFNRINFDTNDGPRDVMIKKKIKKYKRLQFVIKNDEVNEGFGIYQIAKNYIVLGLAKR